LPKNKGDLNIEEKLKTEIAGRIVADLRQLFMPLPLAASIIITFSNV